MNLIYSAFDVFPAPKGASTHISQTLNALLYFGDSKKYGDEDYKLFESGVIENLKPAEVAMLLKKPAKAINIIIINLHKRGYIEILNRNPLQVQ